MIRPQNKNRRHRNISYTKHLFIIQLFFVFFLVSACNPVITFLSFHPDDRYIIPQTLLPKGMEEVFIETKDGVTIQALYLPHPSSKRFTIYFHGNAGNIYHRIHDYEKLHKLGTSILAVSYRGYAKSEGYPSESGIYLDGKAAFDFVKNIIKVSEKNIYILGRSIGTTVAVDLAQDTDIGGLILISPLSSGQDQASFMGLGFAAQLATNAFQNEKKVRRLKAPLLVIHGNQDKIIPIDFGLKVFKAATSVRFFYEVKGGGHNNLTSKFGDQVFSAVSDFFSKTHNTK
ncbi:MAG: Multifunctional-autoprocessing repeats-in-toxin [Alphaproteobacteria bacterium MarineAlpha3_Bin5]|nr:MAG: Multifunctional-autoprocessing repeats-in-toxin [Alphaproteobacteria bacterium MarineAlpha3_Bin5]|tara:strand:+ start:316 stop:1176 length:861 start_codon:yes stop_codon:yes gene_type:complete